MADALYNEEILVEECNRARVAILNRPKQLNVLSLWMMERLKQLYEKWESDSQVSLLIMKGAGRAFCAGGDVVALYRDGNAGQYNLVKNFFQTYHVLCNVLGTCKKPHVALLDGLVFGAGVGVSIHGHIRVVTEKTVFSLPETALGIHSCVAYFLSHLRGFLGQYLGLTGATLDGADMLACGLATHYVPSKSLLELEKALKSFTSGSVEDVSALIDGFTEKVNVKEGSPLLRLAQINRCFSKDTVEEILDALSLEGDNCNGWYKASAEYLRRASPLSLKITLKLIREAGQLSLADCLKLEYRVTVRCISQQPSTDFYEGTFEVIKIYLT